MLCVTVNRLAVISGRWSSSLLVHPVPSKPSGSAALVVGQTIGGLAPVEVTGVHREEQQEPRGRISLALDSTVTSLTDHLHHSVTLRSS